MAKIFVGDQSKVDQAVLQQVQQLPDDYWVLAEFTLRRNYDWFIIRPVSTAPSVLIVTEVKRHNAQLRGNLNGPWEERAEDGEWLPLTTPNGEDKNYYWQAVNAANSLSEWLRNNEPVFNEGRTDVWSQTRIWPDLLILSQPGVRHLLPLKPDSGFGFWFYDLQRWADHLVNWRPNVGPRLTEQDVEQLVNYLRLTPMESPEVKPFAPTEPRTWSSSPFQAPPPAPRVPQPRGDDRVERLERLVAQLSGRVAHLEALLESGQANGESHDRGTRWRQPAVEVARALTEEEREAIVAAVKSAKFKGRSPTFPSILIELSLQLGEDLKSSNYRGFGTAKGLFQQAVREGLIQFGPMSGPAPTIWLAGEAVPMAVEA